MVGDGGSAPGLVLELGLSSVCGSLLPVQMVGRMEKKGQALRSRSPTGLWLWEGSSPELLSCVSLFAPPSSSRGLRADIYRAWRGAPSPPALSGRLCFNSMLRLLFLSLCVTKLPSVKNKVKSNSRVLNVMKGGLRQNRH